MTTKAKRVKGPKWVAPCKIVELNKTTLKIVHLDRPDDPAKITLKGGFEWPQGWYDLFECQALVAISIEPDRVLIEPYYLPKHGAIIEIEINCSLFATD
jgi:hypothetical protein